MFIILSAIQTVRDGKVNRTKFRVYQYESLRFNTQHFVRNHLFIEKIHAFTLIKQM